MEKEKCLKYIGKLRKVIENEEEIYKRKEIKKSGNGLEIIARFRMGNEARANEYWKEERNVKYRLCGKEKKDNGAHI